MSALIRALKGLYMFLMFAVWVVAIAAAIPLALLSRITGRLRGRDPSRFQRLFSWYIGIFLWLLDGGGLLSVLPPEGEIPEGPCVVIANHPGLFDVLVLIRTVDRMSVMVGRKLKRFLPIGGAIRECGHVFSPDPGSALEAVAGALAALRAGYRFQMFPEGTRSPPGELGPFHAGIFRIAEKAGVPVLPVFIRNDPPFLSKTEKWYFPMAAERTVRLDFWEPVRVEKGKSRAVAGQMEKRYREALGLAPKRQDGDDFDKQP